MRTDILGKVNQMPVDLLAEGDQEEIPMSKLGQLFTANWKTRLVTLGRVYRVSIGTVSGGTDVTRVGAGTVLNLDIPQMILAADTGFIIPIELDLGVTSDMDATGDETQVLLTADRITAISAAEILATTGTTEAPDNLLDGASAFAGRCVSAPTADGITDPVHSDILLYKTWAMHAHATGTDFGTYVTCNVQKEWDYPNIIACPCSILAYWGGTAAVTAIGSFVFAHVPASWFPVS